MTALVDALFRGPTERFLFFMELKVAYRVLRKLSDWLVGGFYSDVDVDGYENVPRVGPLIMYVCCTMSTSLSSRVPLL